MTRTTWQVRSTQVMSEVLDGEAVIVDMASGRYHAAPGVGATVWLAIETGCSLEEIVAKVARAHSAVPDDATDHIRGFIDQLVAAGLVVEGQGGKAASAIADTAGSGATPWAPPVLESHDDLADLLLLDPVHEVTEDGWPHAALPGT